MIPEIERWLALSTLDLSSLSLDPFMAGKR